MHPGLNTRYLRRMMLGMLLAGMGLGCGSCAFFAAAGERAVGKTVTASYQGLEEKSVGIVVYADPATLFEYSAAREEISAFITGELQQKMPKIRMVNYKDVIRWQDETLNWQALPAKDIGKHFSVDRVLYVELLDYGTREPGTRNLLRGRIKAVAEVYEVEKPGTGPAWRQEYLTYWPEGMPLEPTKSSDVTVRKRVLESFGHQVAGAFYERREIDKSVREKIEREQ